MSLQTSGVLGQRVNPAPVRGQVRDCALYLDSVEEGWANRVDPDTLDFASYTRCVVGQVWGHVRNTRHWAIIAGRWPGAVTGGRECWRTEILSRRTCPDTVPERWTREIRPGVPQPVALR